MTGNHAAELLRTVRPPDADAPDADLLARFAARRDEAAFRELVRRHGPVVLGVCRRTAGHAEDAEDAFQAVFLILARKAGSVRRPGLLGNYLYGVAVRVARRAKRSAARRRKREVQVRTPPDPPTPPADVWADLAPVLDEELAALPEWYRAAVLLCDVQGLSRAEAATRLGVPEGTLSSRLSAGRKMLADRLARRGITLSATAVTAAVAANGTAAVPDHLIRSVVEAAGGGVTSGLAGELAREGVWPMRAMIAGLATTGAVVVGWAALAGSGDPPTPPGSPAGNKSVADAPAAKPVEFTNRPRLVTAFDLNVADTQQVVWSPDGKRLAIHQLSRPVNAATVNDVVVVPVGAPAEAIRITLQEPSKLVGFAPGGRLVTELREYNLISGKHQLVYWTEPDQKPAIGGAGGPPGALQPGGWAAREVDLEAGETFWVRFAPDGKTFRTATLVSTLGGQGDWAEVREVDAATGRTTRTFPRVEAKWLSYRLSPDGRRVVLVNPDFAIESWDAETGKRVWASRPVERKVKSNEGIDLVFSPDGRRLAVTKDRDFAIVFDAATGERLCAEEEAEGVAFRVTQSAFSADGRLIVWGGDWYQKGTFPPGATRKSGNLIRVWDVDRKAVLKTWTGRAKFAFAPDRPVLAVLEDSAP